MKRSHYQLPLLLLFLALCLFTGKSSVSAASNFTSSHNAEIAITNKRAVLYTGKTLRLKVTVLTSKKNKKNLVYTSSNPEVASISKKGKIKALKKGKTKITVSIKSTDIKTSFKLKVKKTIPLKKLKITAPKQITAGSQTKLKVVLKPKNTTYTNLKYTVNNSSIATISNDGVLQAKTPGRVKVTVRAVGTRKKKSVTIKVLPLHVQKMTFSTTNAKSLEVGKTCKLSLDVTPANTTDKIVWSSNDSTKVSIDGNGSTAAITALRPSEEVIITARTSDKSFSVSYSLKLTKTTNYLTKSDLDDLNLDSIKKVMIVAHPDDETLWGGSHLLDGEYLVVCLTHGWNTTRSTDFKKVMSKTNDKALILSYPDVIKYYKKDGKTVYDTDHLTTCIDGIKKDLNTILTYKDWKEIATHNPDGEYEKYCHEKISELVTSIYTNTLKGNTTLYYFGRYYEAEDADNITDAQISAENLALKKTLLNLYLPTAKGAITAFGHMIPYENWILAEEWSSN